MCFWNALREVCGLERSQCLLWNRVNLYISLKSSASTPSVSYHKVARKYRQAIIMSLTECLNHVKDLPLSSTARYAQKGCDTLPVFIQEPLQDSSWGRKCITRIIPAPAPLWFLFTAGSRCPLVLYMCVRAYVDRSRACLLWYPEG